MKFIRPTPILDNAGTFTRSGNGTYVDSSGVMQTASTNVPRINYRYTGVLATPVELEGLLIEPARTNLLTYSYEFDNAAWTKTNVTVTANTTVAPDGTTTADTLTATAADSSIWRNLALTPSTLATFSVFLKAASNTTLNIIFADWNGVASTYTTVSCNVTTSWQRFNVPASVRSDSVTCGYYIGGFSSFSSGEVVFAWGAQLEVPLASTPVLTSFIPTVGSTATRNADVFTGTGLLYTSVPEAATANLLANPGTMATQTYTTTAQPYTLSFYGTGTITLSGSSTAGPLVGTGVSNRVSLTFTPTAAVLTLTVSGTVTNAQLETGSVTSPYLHEVAWASGTNYSTGHRAIRTLAGTHKLYERLTPGGIDSTAPENALTGVTPKWIEVSPTNRWGLFDEQIGTNTTVNTSMTYIVKPGRMNSLALLELNASKVSISLTLPSTGAIVYQAEFDVNSGTIVGDWYQYFYEPIYEQDSLVVTNLIDTALLSIPAYGEAICAITISAATNVAVSVGVMVVGLSVDVGMTQNAPTVGIIDYSRKETDTFGSISIIKRKYSKRMSAKVMLPSNTVDATTRVLSQYRSTPLVWVGADNLYTSLIIYGFYRDWELSIDNVIMSTYSLSVEGLT